MIVPTSALGRLAGRLHIPGQPQVHNESVSENGARLVSDMCLTAAVKMLRQEARLQSKNLSRKSLIGS